MAGQTKVADPEAGAKAWLKTNLPGLSGRVFYSVPAGTPTMPLVTVALVGGFAEDTEEGLELPRLSFSIWAATKQEASDLRRELVGKLHRLRCELLVAGTYCHETRNIASLWLPDDEAKLARYVVDATLVVSGR